MTRVVNLYKEPYDVYIGRGGKGKDGYFGNPFPLVEKNSEEKREHCLKLYREYFHKRLAEDPEFKRRVEMLDSKVLGCFCKPKLCHGDVIVEYLESRRTT